MRSLSTTKNYICEACVEGCASNKCKSKNFCEQCAECDAFGLLLEDRSVCVSCPSGSIGASNICYCENDCTPNCDICSSWNTCDTCTVGFYKNCENKCAKCSENCASCTDFFTCTTCSSTFYKSDGFCYACNVDGQDIMGANCNICTVKNCMECPAAAGTCTKCKTGLYLIGNTCDPCSVGKWINGNICVVCIENCLTCTDSNTCLRCSSGYYLIEGCCELCREDPDDACQNQIGFRRELDCDNKPKGVCSVCEVANCRTCTLEDICVECVEGYYIDINKVDEVASDLCIPCSTSANQLKVDGKYCYGSNTCTTNCVLCESANKCFTCADYYYRDISGNCVKCPATCLTCEMVAITHVKCVTCDTNYYLTQNNKACVLCTEHGVTKETGLQIFILLFYNIFI